MLILDDLAQVSVTTTDEKSPQNFPVDHARNAATSSLNQPHCIQLSSGHALPEGVHAELIRAQFTDGVLMTNKTVVCLVSEIEVIKLVLANRSLT